MNKLMSFSEKKEVVLVLVIMAFAFFAKTVLLLSNQPWPTVFFDELLYRQNAEAIFHFNKYGDAIYPPMYPLALTPAFLFSNWYLGMLVINAFLASLLVPAVWFLARTVYIKYALIAALIAAVLPFGAVFPRFIMSENLCVPLFVFATALALRGGKRGNFEGFCFGIVLALAHWTKYLFLPALPVFVGVWMYSHYKITKPHRNVNGFSFGFSVLWVLAGYAGLSSAWIIYGLASGFDLSDLSGLSYFASTKSLGYLRPESEPQFADFSHFIMWGTAYASYIALACLPFYGGVPAYYFLSGKQWRGQFSPIQWLFLALIVVLSVGYWLLATQHSLRAGYNYPDPLNLQGRYLMYMVPCYLVSALLLYEVFDGREGVTYKKRAVIGSLFVVAIFVFAWNVLFNKIIWNFPPWFATLTFLSIDVFALKYVWLATFVLFVALLPLFIKFITNKFAQVQIFFVGALVLAMFAVSARQSSVDGSGVHVYELAGPILSIFEETNQQVNVRLDHKDLPESSELNNQLQFFGLSKDKYNIKSGSIGDALKAKNPSQATILLSSSKLALPTLREYGTDPKLFRIYRLDHVDPKILAPNILDYGPKIIMAGVPFNVQPSGSSAMWFRVANLKTTTKIMFDNSPLKLIRGQDGFASGVLPKELFERPREVIIRVFDSQLELEGDSVNVSIHAKVSK
jgi:hypothetical protein